VKSENLFRSWKEIAAYLGCDIRTCLRWEKSLGLPIHRVEGGSKGTVFGYKDELDRWITEKSRLNGRNGASYSTGEGRPKGDLPPAAPATPGRAPKRRLLYNPAFYIPFHLAVFVLIIGLFIIVSHKPVSHLPHGFLIDGSVLTVLDIQRNPIWSYDTKIPSLMDDTAYHSRFQRKIYSDERYARFPWLKFEDIDRDGKVETLFVIKTVDQRAEGMVACFDDRGHEKWHFQAGREQLIGKQPFSADYRIEGIDTADVNQDGKPEVLFYATHYPDYPSQFVILDAAGKELGEYWNPGHFNEFVYADLDGDGRTEIIAGGVNNDHGKGFIVVFDPLSLSGAAPQSDPEKKFKNLSPGSEKYYVLIPRTDVDLQDGYPVDATASIELNKNKEISVLSMRSRLYFEFSYGFEFLRIRKSHAFLAMHKKAFDEGKVRSVLDDAYFENLGKGVSYWNGAERKWSAKPAMSNPW
jgi:hypothetical protein